VFQNKVVVRFQNGNVMKGFTADFMPNKDVFHLTPSDAQPGSPLLKVNIKDCKALFFVKDFEGDLKYNEKKEFDPTRNLGGRKIKVVFKDNETLIGTTQGYQPDRPGFFVFPADPKSNNDRSFVVSAATKQVSFI
jgi:small nuclear ribonucleoprotein (snRNP)-like protein